MAQLAAHFARLVPESISAVKAELAKAEKDRVKAGQTAVKVEGFRLQKMLKKQLAAGKIEGETWEPLSMLARSLGKTTKAGRKLSKAIRYQAKQSGDTFGMAIGFLHGEGQLSSKSWVRIATIFQAGKTWEPDRSFRKYIARRGASMTKRSKYRKFHFIKKSTTTFETPPRQIISPFWDRNKSQAVRNIQSNYIKKLAGERI